MGRRGYLFKLCRHNLPIRIPIKGFLQICSTDQAGNLRVNQVDHGLFIFDIFVCEVLLYMTDQLQIWIIDPQALRRPSTPNHHLQIVQ